MADILKQIVKHMDGVNKAAVADAAAKAMAEHCDGRIEAAKTALFGILGDLRNCADDALDEGRKAESRAYRAFAARLASVIKRL